MDRYRAWVAKEGLRKFRWRAIEKDEWRYVMLLAVGIALFGLLPHLYAWIATPAEKLYLGTLDHLPEHNTSLMWMRQISEGHLLTKNLYSHIPHDPTLINPFHLAASLPNLLLGLPPEWCHLLSRFFAGALLTISAYLFSSLFFEKKQRRFVSTIGILFGAGLGWTQQLTEIWKGPAAAGATAVDRWMPQAFAHPFDPPDFCAATALLLLGLYHIARGLFGDRPGKTLIGGLLLGISAFIHPYYLIIAYTVLGVLVGLIAFECGSFSRRLILHGLSIVFSSLLPTVYLLFLLSRQPGTAGWLLQLQSKSPFPAAYMLGFGIPLVLAAISLFGYFRRRGKLRNPMSLCAVWMLVIPVTFYLPMIPFQRELATGYMIPVTVFALAGLYRILDRTRVRPRLQLRWMLFFMSIICLHSALRIGTLWKRAISRNDRYYVMRSETELLRNLPHEGGTVFATDPACNMIPRFSGLTTVLGSERYTPDWSVINRKVNSFFSGEFTGGQMRTLLEQLRVTYLYYGAHERELDRTRSIPARMKALGWETVCRDEQSECMVFRNINLTTGTAEPSGMRAARPSLHQVDGFGMSE